MRLGDLLEELENICPRAYALDWDNVGLLVGDEEAEIETVYLALDATDGVIEHAVEARADLLLTHHPLIFKPISSVRADDMVGRRIIKLLSNDISYVATHTNYDVALMGEMAAKRLGLFDTDVLEVTAQEGDMPLGIGAVGNIMDIDLYTLAEKVKCAFNITNVKIFGEAEKQISRVAICPGSGKGEVEFALATGADVFITGDIDHHTGIDAVAQGLAIIDAGHYGIEHIYLDDMESALIKTGLNIIKEPFEEPFWVI